MKTDRRSLPYGVYLLSMLILMFVTMQRYNRPRVVRLAEKQNRIKETSP